jgi:serine/threonine protein kinase
MAAPQLNNVFLAAPTLAPGGLPICKVADLGGSKDLGVNSACDTFIGSAQFIPPEVYAGVLGELDGVQAPTYDGRAMDVWSMGVMLHIMLRGNYMFQKSATDCDGTAQGKALAREGRLAKVLTDEAERMAKAGWISPGCHRVLLACFTVDPAARPTAAALLEDAWVKEGAAMLPQLVRAKSVRASASPAACAVCGMCADAARCAAARARAGADRARAGCASGAAVASSVAAGASYVLSNTRNTSRAHASQCIASAVALGQVTGPGSRSTGRIARAASGHTIAHPSSTTQQSRLWQRNKTCRVSAARWQRPSALAHARRGNVVWRSGERSRLGDGER